MNNVFLGKPSLKIIDEIKKRYRSAEDFIIVSTTGNSYTFNCSKLVQPLKLTDEDGNLLEPFNKYDELKNTANITKVLDLSGNVLSIGDYAFSKCINLSAVYVPNCEYIGLNAFETNPSLMSFLNVEKLPYIYDNSFKETDFGNIIFKNESVISTIFYDPKWSNICNTVASWVLSYEFPTYSSQYKWKDYYGSDKFNLNFYAFRQTYELFSGYYVGCYKDTEDDAYLFYLGSNWYGYYDKSGGMWMIDLKPLSATELLLDGPITFRIIRQNA